jgi:hypothetical protein
MFPDHREVHKLREQQLHLDRRPLPRDSEIRLRVKRLTRVYL